MSSDEDDVVDKFSKIESISTWISLEQNLKILPKLIRMRPLEAPKGGRSDIYEASKFGQSSKILASDWLRPWLARFSSLIEQAIKIDMFILRNR